MNSLSSNERKVVFSAQFHARSSIADLSRRTGLRSHTVRYALDQLRERRVLKPYSFIDSENLGYAAYNLFCALSSHRADVRERFERTLSEHQNVSGAYRIGGDFHYRIVILARTTCELLEIMDAILGTFGEIVFERSFVIRCGAWLFSRKYLSPKGKAEKPLYVEPKSGVKSIDTTDFQILRSLGEEGEWQIAPLAAKLKLPVSTLEYRVRRLEKEGIVKGWVYSIDASSFGMLDYRLLVTMKQIDEATRQSFFTFCARHPNFYTLVRCIGSWDYEIGVEVESQERVIDIVQNIYEAFSNTVRSVKSIPTFQCLKTSMFPFRAEADSTKLNKL